MADLTDAKALTAAFSGCDIILHLADSPERHQSAQARPTSRAEAVCAAAGQAGVTRVVYASSIYARIAPDGTSAAYGAIKRANEDVFARADTLCPVLLRLPPVYGKGSKGGFSVLVGLVRRGWPVPFGSALALRDYIAVANLADLVLTMVDAPHERWQEHRGKRYEPCDGQAISTADLVAHIKKVTGSGSVILKVPVVALKLLGRMTGKGAAIDAVLEPLHVAPEPSVTIDWDWRPPHQLPETLRYIKG